ncbi:MAG TPA: GNAT family N-acetyltransferase [Ignavibacteria bacterium]|nr:GNAT family N-acetyltransferase [Ignavibacteria bacterium]HMR39355.1 GNAT family N-acetyltransferase [Ignavibacteria bacterium]
MRKFNDDVFDQFPVLKTERLLLREITYNDAEDIFQIRKSEEVMKYFGHYPYKEIPEAYEMIEQVKNGFKNREGIRWGISFHDSDKLIGTGGVWRILKEHLRGEIGYELSEEHWKQGIMFEALSAVTDFAFDKMNLHSIEANLDPENTGSVKLLEKLGFIKEGHIKDSYLFDGKFTDTGIYSLIRN